MKLKRCIRFLPIFLVTRIMMVNTITAQVIDPSVTKATRNIYEKLKDKVGDKDADWPELTVWGIENRGGIYLPKSNAIYLDRVLVEACSRFGDLRDDALSFIIAHEMAHFHQKHQWSESGLVGRFMLPREEFTSKRNLEAQADLYGAFLSYQAGFNTTGLVPQLLDSIYLLYNLDTGVNVQYPSLEDRKLIANESCDLANILIETYQMANYLMVLGRFDAADELYNHVGENLQFVELHYNRALAKLMLYVKLADIRLKYPFAIDSKIPIRREPIKVSADALLTEGIHTLEMVLEDFDPDYLMAKMMLIAAYDWVGEPHKAERLLTELENNPKMSNSDLYVLTKANFLAWNGNLPDAVQLYRSINSSDGDFSNIKNLAKQNLEILDGRYSKKSGSGKVIKNQSGLDGVASLIFYKDFQYDLNVEDNWEFSFATEFNSIISRLVRPQSRFYMQRFETPYVKCFNHIGVGTHTDQLRQYFSDTEIESIDHVDGSYVIVYGQGLIFKVNHKSRVEEWISFTF